MKKPGPAKVSLPQPVPKNPNAVEIQVQPGEDPEITTARVMTGPHVGNAYALLRFAKGTTVDLDLSHIVTAMCKASKRVRNNDMGDVEAMLTSQAILLNAMSADLVRRSALNMDEYMEAAHRYLTLALKAQNQCRMTLETLSNIKNPPVVYAKQANIANGPQQVNNGTDVAPRAREAENPPNKLLEASNEQSLDTGTPSTAGSSDNTLATVGEVDRAKDG